MVSWHARATLHWTSQANPAGQFRVICRHTVAVLHRNVHTPPGQPPVQAAGQTPIDGIGVAPQSRPDDEALDADEDDDVVPADEEEADDAAELLDVVTATPDEALVEEDELDDEPVEVGPPPPALELEMELLDVATTPPPCPIEPPTPGPEPLLDALAAPVSPAPPVPPPDIPWKPQS
jgi:hypothetical protein